MRPERPTALVVQSEHIPSKLKALPNWALWSYTWDEARQEWDKPPYQGASSTDPATWRTFDEAYELYQKLGLDGLFVAAPLDCSLTGGDFDHCLVGGRAKPAVENVLKTLHTYVEVSPSAGGLRSFNFGPKTVSRSKIIKDGSQFEFWDNSRFLSVTGHRYAGYPATINEDPAAVAAACNDIFGDEPAPSSVVRVADNPKLSDGEVIKKAQGAKNGEKFRRLFFDGDLGGYDNDDSRGDEALCFLLAFFCDHDQIDHIFRKSALYREKWDRKTGTTTYGELTIEKACLLVTETYQGTAPSNGSETAATTKKAFSDIEFDVNVRDSLCEITRDKFGQNHYRVLAGQVAKYLRNNYFDFITFRDNELIEYYDPNTGLYTPGGESQIKEACEKILDDLLTTQTLQQITAHIQRQTYVDRAKVDAIDVDRVALNNGILNTRTRELVQFSPDKIYRRKWPCNFDPSASTLEVEQYMLSAFHEDDIRWLQEFYGWHFVPNMQYQKNAMLIGDGGNGKTIFESILMAILGEENVSTVSLQSMNNDPYATAELYLKVANIYDDLPQWRMRDTGHFKILSGGMRARAREIYQRPFYFWNYAKGTYTTNKLPGTWDLSSAFFRRWMLAQMPYTFVDAVDTDGNPTELAPGERYKEDGILEKKTTPAMLSSWLNWMLDGLDRLRKNDRFSESKTQDQIRDIWIMQTEPVSMFAKECLVRVAGEQEEKASVYKAYQKWCEENDAHVEDVSEFAKKMQTVIRTTPTRPRDKERGRLTCWADIRLKPEYGDDENDDKKPQKSPAGKLPGADEDDDEKIVPNNDTTQNETEPLAGFGQGGQGYAPKINRASEKNHSTEEVVEFTPDRADQMAVRSPFQQTSKNRR